MQFWVLFSLPGRISSCDVRCHPDPTCHRSRGSEGRFRTPFPSYIDELHASLPLSGDPNWPRRGRARRSSRPPLFTKLTSAWSARPAAQLGNGRAHFFAAAAQAMRRILIDGRRLPPTDRPAGPEPGSRRRAVAGVARGAGAAGRREPLAAEVVSGLFAGLSVEQAAEPWVVPATPTATGRSHGPGWRPPGRQFRKEVRKSAAPLGYSQTEGGTARCRASAQTLKEVFLEALCVARRRRLARTAGDEAELRRQVRLCSPPTTPGTGSWNGQARFAGAGRGGDRVNPAPPRSARHGDRPVQAAGADRRRRLRRRLHGRADSSRSAARWR